MVVLDHQTSGSSEVVAWGTIYRPCKPIIHLITHGQVSTFLQEVFKFLALVHAVEMTNLLVVSAKQSQVFPCLEKHCKQTINQCSHIFPGLPHTCSDGSKRVANNRQGDLFGEPSLA